MRCIAEPASRPILPPHFRAEPAFGLREFRPSDVPPIGRIVAEALHEHYDPSLYISLSQPWPDGFRVAAGPADQPVGFLLGVHQVEGEGRVLMFAVDREWRRRGVGRALMDEFLGIASHRGLRRATLEVRVSNATAIRFYARYRFSVVDLLRGYYSDGENGYQMSREIP